MSDPVVQTVCARVIPCISGGVARYNELAPTRCDLHRDPSFELLAKHVGQMAASAAAAGELRWEHLVVMTTAEATRGGMSPDELKGRVDDLITICVAWHCALEVEHGEP
jgi:hypothetical protein